MRALVFLLLFSNAALADDAALLRCRAIRDSAARLACYDALVVPAATGKAAPSAPAQSAPQLQPGSRSPAQAAPAPTAEQFGLEHKKAESVLAAIESTIPGQFEGWRPNASIRLANGQVWRIADDSSASLSFDNPKVRIRRGMLGAFYLEIEGTNRSPRVTRLQ